MAANGHLDHVPSTYHGRCDFSRAEFGVRITSQPFTLQYSDSTGAAYLQSMWVLFDTTLSTQPCELLHAVLRSFYQPDVLVE